VDVFEFAMKMEQDGRDFYLRHAETVDNPALKKILLELADDEAKHFAIFKALRDGQNAEYKDEEQTKIFGTVKNVFEEIKANNPDYTPPAKAKDIWEEARAVEKRAEEFYRETAKELGDEHIGNILNRIADEEHKHWVTMENVIRYLDRPQHWLEDAEWSNLEDY
jgi:rubrerythrin